MSEGWICPRCHVVHAPSVAQCSCAPDVQEPYLPLPNLSTPLLVMVCPHCGAYGMHTCADVRVCLEPEPCRHAAEEKR